MYTCVQEEKVQRKEVSKKEAAAIKKMWEKCFIPANVDRNKIYLDSYLWHIFSYKVREHKTREDAMHAFKRVRKDSIYIFYQFMDKGYLIEKASDLRNADLDDFINGFEQMDIYIVDKEFRWTYARTHEEPDIGLFFAERI